MKRKITAALSILAVVTGVGWKLASHPGSSTGLGDVRLIQHSEHSTTGKADELAGIRIRLSPGVFESRSGLQSADVPHVIVTE